MADAVRRLGWKVLLPVGLAAAGALLLGALAPSDLGGWSLLVILTAPLAAVLAGLTGGALVGAAATGVAYVLLGFYLGFRYPSTGLCLFDCEQVPETFGNTAGPVWVATVGLMVMAAFGAALKTDLRNVALLAGALVLALAGAGWNMLAPERWHELSGLIVPVVLAFSSVLILVEVRKLLKEPDPGSPGHAPPPPRDDPAT